MGYRDQQLPIETPCTDLYDSACSITNSRSLCGKAQNTLSKADSQSSFEEGLVELSFSEEFRIQAEGGPELSDGFYVFAYHYSGALKGHAILRNWQTNLAQIVSSTYPRCRRAWPNTLTHVAVRRAGAFVPRPA